MIGLPIGREPEPRYARHTPDGFVILSPAAIELVLRGRLTHEEATTLWVELARASFNAKQADQILRGYNEWVSRPLPGGDYEIIHGGETCRFRPITNGKRRQRPGRRARSGHLCTVCQQESPEGATMYVPAQDDPRRTKGLWGGRRLCSMCVRPELAAALLGVALTTGEQ